MLHLVFPNKSHEEMWRSVIAEFEAADVKITPYALKLGLTDYDEYLTRTIGFHNNTEIAANFVQSSTYFLMDGKQDKILGAVNIRHTLNEYLLRIGGHIGYGVAPSERRKGYATKMLALALDKCRELGLERVLVTCDKENIGSARTIQKNGGILENEIEENGEIVQRYWIDLNIRPVSESDLPVCLEVIHKGFGTVAEEFGFTPQNCAGHPAFMRMEHMLESVDRGDLLYGYYADGKIVGFVRIVKKEDNIYEMGKLAVLPEYRHFGIGKKLMNFVKSKVHSLGGKKLVIGIVEENTRLKDWYLQNGFIHTGTMLFSHLPFTVGYMEVNI